MIEVPPPTTISAPRMPSRSRGMKPRSWMPTIARSASDAVKAVLNLRGIIWVVGADAGEGVARDVPHRVAAALPRAQPRIAELADELRGVGKRHVVHLNVLAGRDVALAERHVALDHVGERLELVGVDPAERQLHPDHLAVRLALPVDALLEAELDELVLGLLAAHEACGLGVEVVELALEDRDHVPGDVVVDLRVLERPDPPLAVLRPGQVLVELGGVCLRLGGGGRGLHAPAYYRKPDWDLPICPC